jgi:hypothetical protein
MNRLKEPEVQIWGNSGSIESGEILEAYNLRNIPEIENLQDSRKYKIWQFHRKTES